MFSIPSGYNKLVVASSDNIGGVWYNPHDAKLIIQFSRGLAHYRYSNVTQAKVDIMCALTEGLGAWIRAIITQNVAEHPFEKLT